MIRKRFLQMIVLALLVSLAAACSGSNSGGSGQGGQEGQQQPAGGKNEPSAEPAGEAVNWDPFTPYEETVTFTLGRMGVAGNNLPEGDTLEDNQYIRYVEDKLNLDIQYDFYVDDAEAYKQKVNLAISSSSIPDVMIVDESQFLTLLESDMLADLTEAYEKSASPFIKSYYESFDGRVLEAVTFDGKLMALPDTNLAGTHHLLWVRKDWLDQLNLELPNTVDDVAAVAKAFKDNAPGGEGTVGLLGDPIMYGDGAFFTFDPIFNAYDSFPANWLKDESGDVVYGSTTPETKAALEKLRQMYADGVIDREFVTRKWADNAALVANGKAGILFAPWFAGWMLSDSVKNDPKAEWVPLTAPVNADGMRKIALSRPSGQYLVVRKGYEHPEAVLKALSVQYEGLRLRDPAAEELYKGLGVSWLNWPLNLQLNFEDAVYRDATALQTAFEAKDPSSLSPDQLPKYESLIADEQNPKQDIAHYANKLAFYIGGMEVGSDKLEKVQPVFYGQTETMTTRGTNLGKMEAETFLKIITGASPLDDFDKFVADWKRLGGDDITEEIEQIIHP